MKKFHKFILFFDDYLKPLFGIAFWVAGLIGLAVLVILFIIHIWDKISSASKEAWLNTGGFFLFGSILIVLYTLGEIKYKKVVDKARAEKEKLNEPT